MVFLGIAAAFATWTASAADDPPRAEELFAVRVLPIFQEKCFACHGTDPEDVRGAFTMLSREGLLQGGESQEPAVVPGQPEASPLYRAVNWAGREMPPKENDRLTAEQIEYIKQWIAGGAPWPSPQRIAELTREARRRRGAHEGIDVRTSGGLAPEWTLRKYAPENLWAYQPLWRDTTGRLQSPDNHPLDVLIQERAARLGLPLAAAAKRRTLIRRATFDLIGLPPKPQEVRAFLEDPAPDDEAFAAVVERLLASPHYGEQWARHWLDVVRYADSSGYANDYERGNAWRYRDYVVRAFNQDKPYDQFICEQLAGDEIDSNNSELLIAVGFLRMGPWELTGMEVPRVARQRFLDDVTDAVGQVFLAQMLQCARCHDHKFDPVPTRDYYAIQAVFATTQLAERKASFLPTENTDGFSEVKYLEQRQQYYRAALQAVESKRSIAAARDWLEQRGYDRAALEEAVASLQKSSDSGRTQVSLDEVRAVLAKQGVDPAQIPPRHVGFEPRDFGIERIARKGLERLRWRWERYEPFALSVYAGRTPRLNSVYAPLRIPAKPLEEGELETTCILVGGDPFAPSTPVSPDGLSVVDFRRDTGDDRRGFTSDVVGRRLALANWIASPDNPLTARVMVNRVWQWHFGQPLAANPNNFGATGKKPTHPELLDWLAAQFMEAGWSVKALHRLIMNSQTYRRAADHPDPQALAEKDPLGESYAVFQPRRLDAEELQDAMLCVSGELNPTLGGIPVCPEIHMEAAFQPRQVMGAFAEAWQPSPLPAQRHRRSLYALRLRGQRDPFLEVFNAPGLDLCCEARATSTVTPQVFALFNSATVFQRALALANRVSSEEPDPPAALQRLFEIVYGRPASASEMETCLQHWQHMIRRHQRLHFAAPVYPTEIVREAIEENTGEKFVFTEPLEVSADFVPDLRPCDASAELRGLAEVCLVLLNSNEFVYVY